MTADAPKEYRRAGHRNPFPTTDAIIEYREGDRVGDREGIILITRRNPPYGLAIPGGFAEWGISLEDNVRKEAMEETGLAFHIANAGKPLCVRSDPQRDPRGHMISVVYVGQGYGKLQAGDDAAGAQLYTHDEVRQLIATGKLAFDHGDILREYLVWRGMREVDHGTR